MRLQHPVKAVSVPLDRYPGNLLSFQNATCRKNSPVVSFTMFLCRGSLSDYIIEDILGKDDVGCFVAVHLF